MPKLPFVAIVGRPNVGKSSLLNALAGRLISIVQDMPGVTRDRISTPLQIDGKFVELVDTGGYGFNDDQGLTEHIKHQIEIAMHRADLVLFVVDCQAGLTAGDSEIANLLRKLNRKTILVANKADAEKAEVALGDFSRLGLGTPIGVSALTKRNIDDVVSLIGKNVDLKNAPTSVPEPEMLIAIVGKRNAGKSTLVNAVAELYEGQGDRVIVSEVPGTTRDSVDVRFEKEGKSLVVIDTAGVRKKRHMVTNDIEFYSFHRAERSIRRANVVFMLVDAVEPLSEPDKKLAGYIAQEMKPVIIVVNKWDLALEKLKKDAEELGEEYDDSATKEKFREYLNAEMPRMEHAPIAFITAKDGKNIQALLDLAQHLHKQATTRLSTGVLNRVFRQIIEERRPSSPAGRRSRIYYVTQTDISPPTLVLMVNNPDHFSESYQRYMLNRLRDLLPFDEVPIKLLFRGKMRDQATKTEEILDREAERPKKLRPQARQKKHDTSGKRRGRRKY